MLLTTLAPRPVVVAPASRDTTLADRFAATFLDHFGVVVPPPIAPPTVAAQVDVSVWKRLGNEWALATVLKTYSDVSYEPRHNQAGVWSLRVPFDAQTFNLNKNHLLTFDFRDSRMTGLITSFGAASNEQGQPMLEVTGVDALALLGDYLCYPDPNSPPDAQLVAKYRRKGPAETVLTNLIAANVARRGDDITVAPSQGRGAEVTLNLFFKNLLEQVTKKAEVAGIAVRMGLVNTTTTRAEMKVEFYQSVDRSVRVRLSHKANTLRSWSQSDQAPTGTTAIVAASVQASSRRIVSVNLESNAMTVDPDATNHNLQTGSRIKLGGDAPAPLDTSSDYFAIRVDQNTFKVAKTRADASDGTEVNLTEAGLSIESVQVAANTLTASAGSLPKTGKAFRFLATGTAPGPLTVGTDYYAIRVNRDTMKVAATEAAANAGNAIAITGNGAGDIRILEAGSIKVTEINRILRKVVDNPTEAEWGRSIEVFIDARDEDSKDNSVISERGNEALAEMVSQSAFELEGVEAEGLRYGQHYHLGDKVTVELLTGVSKVDRLRAVNISATSEGGVTVQLIPGNPDAAKPLFGQAAIIRGIRAQVRALESEES